jgi:hypothetical protein
MCWVTRVKRGSKSRVRHPRSPHLWSRLLLVAEQTQAFTVFTSAFDPEAMSRPRGLADDGVSAYDDRVKRTTAQAGPLLTGLAPASPTGPAPMLLRRHRAILPLMGLRHFSCRSGDTQSSRRLLRFMGRRYFPRV